MDSGAFELQEINPLERLARVIECSSDLLPLRWLCGRFGGFFVQDAAFFQSLKGRKGTQVWFDASLRIHDLRRW